MMNLIQKFFNKENFNKVQFRKNFSEYFYSLPEHQWMAGTVAITHFENLFKRLPVGVLDAMMKKYPVVFQPSDILKNHHNAGIAHKSSVFIFPEFYKLIMTNKASAEAYLAHELAMVLYELEETQKADPLMAEVEADKFVCDIGLTFELEEFLLMLDETIEKRMRLTYLTINHFTQDS